MIEHIPQTVLVVDDLASNIKTLVEILKDDYRLKVALTGKKALEIVNSPEPPDIVLLDVMMPEMDGYEVCRRIKSQIKTKNIPVIFVTAKNDDDDETLGFELGAVDYITKPIHHMVVKARIKTHLALSGQNLLLERKVAERTKDLYSTRLEVIRRLGIAAEFKDNDTGLHIIRMSKYSHAIAKGYGFSDSEADILLNAAPMHDVGKIGIPDNILHKPDKLTSQEWIVMKTHTSIGAKIIGAHDNALLRTAKTVALTHHEKWNGTGYPEGLSGENIPIEGRIVAVADVFDALTSNRPYKKAWSVEEAFDLLLNERGNHFDPELIKIFFANIEQILSIKELHTDKKTSLK